MGVPRRFIHKMDEPPGNTHKMDIGFYNKNKAVAKVSFAAALL